jgi:hypothetical protein
VYEVSLIQNIASAVSAASGKANGLPRSREISRAAIATSVHWP